MTAEQTKRIEIVTERFGCKDDHIIEEHPFGLPEGYVLVVMGARKGRVRSFGIGPEGDTHS